MVYMKKVTALVLALVLVLGIMSFASAAPSPTVAPTDGDSTTDVNTEDHTNTTVTTKVSGDTAKVTKVESKDATVQFKNAKGADGSTVAITSVEAKVFNSKSGRKIRTVNFASSASNLVVKANAFKGSNVKKIKFTGTKTTFNKNAFSGTKVKTVTMVFNSGSTVVFKKGSLKGITVKAKFEGLSAKEKKALKKAIKSAGGKVK